jgi:hypothetical protein
MPTLEVSGSVNTEGMVVSGQLGNVVSERNPLRISSLKMEIYRSLLDNLLEL